MAGLFQWVAVCLSLCTSVVTSSTSPPTAPTSSTSSIPSLPTNLLPTNLPTSGTGQQTTCSALQTIANTSSYCSTIDSCKLVQCSALGINTDIGVVPCNDPPAVTIVSYQGDIVLFNRTVTQSQTIPVVVSGIPLMTLNVTIVSEEDAINLKIDGMPPLGDTIPLVPETRIPIDRSNCPNHNHTHSTMPPDSATTPPGGGTTPPGGRTTPLGTPSSHTTILETTNGTPSILVLIVVPIAVLSVAVIVVVVVITVTVVYLRKKKLRDYTFQRMAFTDVNNEDDD